MGQLGPFRASEDILAQKNGDTFGDHCAPSNDEHSSHYGLMSRMQSSDSKVERGKLDILGMWILSFSIRQEIFLMKTFYELA